MFQPMKEINMLTTHIYVHLLLFWQTLSPVADINKSKRIDLCDQKIKKSICVITDSIVISAKWIWIIGLTVLEWRRHLTREYTIL